MNPLDLNWEVYREAPTSCTGYNSVLFGISENYSGTFSGDSGIGYASLYATSPNFMSGDWRTAIPTTTVSASNFPFHISLTSTAPDGTQTVLAYAYGELTATSVTRNPSSEKGRALRHQDTCNSSGMC